MKVGKVYQTIRGEGPNIGQPAIFLELDSKGKEMTNGQIINTLKKAKPSRLLVITGEPLLQMIDLCSSMDSLIRNIRKKTDLPFTQFEMEIDETIIPDENAYWNADYFSIIPKAFTEESAKKIDAILSLVKDVSYIMLEVGSRKELETKINWIFYKVKTDIRSHNIFLIPKGKNSSEMRKISELLVTTCIQEGFTFSPKLHTWLGTEELK